MGTRRTSSRREELAAAQRSFEQWRRSRRTRRERIPERLWQMAVEAAVIRGVGATARQLRLNPRKLKERMPAAELAAGQTPPHFVEWPWVEGTALPECVLEAEAPGGTKLRIHLKATATLQAAALGRMLWRDEG